MSSHLPEDFPGEEDVKMFIQRGMLREYLAALSVASAISEKREAGMPLDASEYVISIAGVDFFAVPLEEDVTPPTDELSARRRS